MSADRLHSVLRLRELAERTARGATAQGQRRVDVARERVAERVDAVRALVPPDRPLGAAELRVLQLQGLAQHDLVVAALADVDVAEHDLVELRRAWSLASVQRKSVERLVEQRRVEAAVEARKAADRALDEVVLLQRRDGR